MYDLFNKVKEERELMVKTKIESIRQSIISILGNDPLCSMTNECFFAYKYLLDVLKLINKTQYESYERATSFEIFDILREIKEKELLILELGINIDVLLRYDLTYPIKSPDEIHKEISDKFVKTFSKHIRCYTVKPKDQEIDLEIVLHKVKINENPISEIKIAVWTTYGIQLHSGIMDIYGHFQPFVVTALSADINGKVKLSETGEDIIDQDEYTALLEAKKYIEQNYPKRIMMGFK
jgi:hypothetical protein